MTTLTNRPKAYSYVRFSTPDQEKGDSFRRQTEAAARYALQHGLEIDTGFEFHDLGVSAFRGGNKAEGMLGEFLAFVQSGDIPRGSYLLVENLDRVSREKPRRALRTLEDIVEAGVNVVTLSDNREYTADSLDRDPMMLFASIMMFTRANEESETKARRLREVWGQKRATAAVRPLTSISPAWVRLLDDRSGFELIPERATVVQRIFAMTLDGAGQHAIAEALNKEGVRPFGTKRRTPEERRARAAPRAAEMWHRSYIKKILGDPATVGVFTPHRLERIEGKKVRVAEAPIEGYYPAVIDRETFDRVGSLANGRATRQATEAAPAANILAGLAKCPACGATMTRVNKGGGKKGGRPYLVCTTAKAGAGCDYRTVRMDRVEDAVREKAETLMIELPTADEAVQRDWESLANIERGLIDGIDNVLEAIRKVGPSDALLTDLRQQEAALADVRQQLAEAERRLADTLTNRVQSTVGALVDTVEADTLDVAKANALLRQLFDRVVIDYPSGQLQFHWRHAPGEVTGLMYEWPRDDK